MLAVHGTCAPKFDRVRDAFVANFAERGEIGAAVSVWHEGEKVVDLWAGTADVDTKRPWNEDTLGVLFSATKGLVATCLRMLADRGQLDIDAPVTRYWPEFGQKGKERVTVGTLLDHRAGLVGLDYPIGFDDLEDQPARVAPHLAAQAPAWEPGTAQGYHGVTFGLYAAELFRRVEGRTIGAFLRDEVAGPLGADVHMGIPDSLEPRVATLIPTSREKFTRIIPAMILGYGVEGRIYRSALRRSSDTARAFANPSVLGIRGVPNFNLPRVHQMELPWANAVATASGLARVYAAMAHGGQIDDVRLVSPEALDEVKRRRSWAMDRVLHKQMGFSLGFLKDEPHLFSPNRESFGHPGAGGALGWADPVRNVSIGYVMNRMSWRLRSPRAVALAQAVNRSL